MGYPPYWNPDVLNHFIISKFKQMGRVTFIQVGSNNGINGDPLYPFIMKNMLNGLLVEPVAYLFEELLENYKSKAGVLQFENSALANMAGPMPFYRLKKADRSDLPVFYDQIGSFNKEVVLKHKPGIPGFDDLFIVDNVNTLTFQELVDKYQIQHFDLLHIDTEGYDYEILKMVDFSLYHPSMIMFEHIHLSVDDYRNALKLLKNAGYRCGRVHRDTWCIKNKSF